MARAKNKWFQKATEEAKPLGWRKEDTQRKRRAVALANRRGNLLAAARALQSLANVTRDAETRHKSQADAHYFYNLYRKKKKQTKGTKQ